MVFVAYQIINLACATANCWGRPLPAICFGTMWVSIISLLVIIITVPTKAPTHQPPSFVFTKFINLTGWKSDGIAYIVGLINPNWAFNGLDAATHLAEEVLNPEKVVPTAIMATVAIGAVTAWLFAIAMMFSIQDFTKMAISSTGVPVLELFLQTIGSKAASIFLCSMIIATGFGCVIACQTWQARLCWSFARDSGLPCSAVLSRIHPQLRVPINAHLVSVALVSILGCLYLASYTAFNSMAVACVVLLYASYSIPVICLLIKGRANIVHGPFWLGSLGHFFNYVLLAWLLFTLVVSRILMQLCHEFVLTGLQMYSFPFVYPVHTNNMNYVSAVYAIIFLLVVSWWYMKAQKHYTGTPKEDSQAALSGAHFDEV